MLKLAALITALTVAAPVAMASPWSAFHPRRAEVNDRLANQNARVDAGVRDGQLTRGQAAQLHREDHAIRNQERGMAARDGGHITAHDQRVLNHEENQVSGQIHGERRGN
jgi:hypothetical protein|nr:hypothetical protein [Kofleriaceae bacterium]